MMLANLSSAIQVASGGDIGEKNIESPELRALLENFVSSSDEIAYATLLNSEAKGISAGRIAPDAFLQRELEHAYTAARDGRAYNGQALVVGEGKAARTIFLVSAPVQYEERFLGMIASVVDLQFLIRRLREVSGGGLTPYVVDSQGRLVAAATPEFATGQDMKNLEIVRTFVDGGNKAQFAETREFNMNTGSEKIEMLGHLQPSPVVELGGGGAEAATRRLPRRIRDAAYGSPACVARRAAEHWSQHLRRAAYYESAFRADGVQPGYRQGRFLTARSSDEPDGNRRTCTDVQHDV